MRAYIVTIGDEILLGQIIDTNAARIANYLREIGGVVVEKRTIGDDPDQLLETLPQALSKAEVVVLTGGLGPTRDDRTKETLARFFNVGMVEHGPTKAFVESIYRERNREITEAVKGQWMVPENAVVLPNKLGTAPGMWFDFEGKVIVSLPGVPSEMEYLMENEVLPRLKARFEGTHVSVRTILTVGEGESTLARWLEPFEDTLPENVSLAYLPRPGQVRLRLTVKGDDPKANDALLDRKLQELVKLLPPHLIASMDDDVLESAIGKLLRERGLQLATAESCTGGYLAHLITSVPGASDYFKGSIIAYSNEIKQHLLGVQAQTLGVYGAVSEQTVREMVAGALKALDVDVAISVSGIAGPGGGTPDKPVGTVWIAVGNGEEVRARKFLFGKDRRRNIEYAAVSGLIMLRNLILDIEDETG